MLGLGNSVGTPRRARSRLLVVSGIDELDSARRRSRGAYRALQRAVHRLRRDRDLPHLRAVPRGARGRRGVPRAIHRHRRAAHAAHGHAHYRPDAPRSRPRRSRVEDALRLQRLSPTRASACGCDSSWRPSMQGDADSANVVGEIVGRERPDEIVVVGGHFDSWDVGTGAIDEAADASVDLGSGAADEGAESAAAANSARRAVHQRRERAARRPRLSRSAPGQSSRTTS